MAAATQQKRIVIYLFPTFVQNLGVAPAPPASVSAPSLAAANAEYKSALPALKDSTKELLLASAPGQNKTGEETRTVAIIPGTGELWKVVSPMVVQEVQNVILSQFEPEALDKIRNPSSGSSGTTGALGASGANESANGKDTTQKSEESLVPSAAAAQTILQDEKLRAFRSRQLARPTVLPGKNFESNVESAMPPPAPKRNGMCLVGGTHTRANIEWRIDSGLVTSLQGQGSTGSTGSGAGAFTHNGRNDKPAPFPSIYPQTLHAGEQARVFDGSRYMTCAIKDHGIQVRLVCMRFYNHALAVLVTRAWDMYMVNLDLPPRYYDGSIVDGELVLTTSRGPTLLLHNALLLNGRHVSALPHQHRLQLLSSWLHGWATRLEQVLTKQTGVKTKLERLDPECTSTDAVQVGATAIRPDWSIGVRVKRYYALEELPRVLVRVCPRLDYAMDGWILMAADAPDSVGHGRDCLKIKQGCEHTVDFAMHVHPQTKVRTLLLRNGKRWVKWTTLQRPATQYEEEKMHGQVVECRYDKQKGQWEPERLRFDKPHTNRPGTALGSWADTQEDKDLSQIFPRGIISDSALATLRQWSNLTRHTKGSARWSQKTTVPDDGLPIQQCWPQTTAHLYYNDQEQLSFC